MNVLILSKSLETSFCYIIAFYSSPSQPEDIFEKSFEKTKLNLDSLFQGNLFSVVLIGDFHAKSKNWYKNDECSFEGNNIEDVRSKFCLQQVIKESPHILDNSSSRFNLIFTLQVNLIIESVVHPPIHSNCHY